MLGKRDPSSPVSRQPINLHEPQRDVWRLFSGLLLLAFVVSAGVVFLHTRKTKADEPHGRTDELEQLSLLANRSDKKGTAVAQAAEQPIDQQKYLFQVPAEARRLAVHLSAQAAFIGDMDSGKAMLAYNEHNRLYPASTTKIVSAIVAKQSMAMSRQTTVSAWAASAEPNRMGLIEGEQLSVEELLQGMLINSGNDAARALAEAHPGGQEAFYQAMNDMATRLGLVDSHFVNSSGLHDDKHVSSVYDLAVFMRYLVSSQPDLMAIMRTTDKTIEPTATHPAYTLHTLSTMLKNGADLEAVKTGYTPEAGHTWVATLKRGNRHVVIAFMNSWASTDDATKLIDLAFQ